MGHIALDAHFWGALVSIIGINLVLAGDNAIVIALAARYGDDGPLVRSSYHAHEQAEGYADNQKR